jgi:hypothetical protein
VDTQIASVFTSSAQVAEADRRCGKIVVKKKITSPARSPISTDLILIEQTEIQGTHMTEKTEEETEKPGTKSTFVTKANHFITKHHFAVCAIPPGGKVSDVIGWSSFNLLTRAKGNYSPEKFIQKYPQFAHYEVGIFGSCGMHWMGHDEHGNEILEGNICILDIDAQGVLETIEEEAGPLPYGYTVYSRPKTAPWKQHHYFRHTKHSIEQFTKLGIESAKKSRDRRARELRHPGQWDLKGSGDKGGYVVAAGTPREGEEAYTCFDDEAPVPDFPDWLVDWFCADVRTQRLEERRQTRLAGGAEEEPKDPVRRHVNSRAKSFALLGVRPEDIELLLKHQVEDFSPDGEVLVTDPEWLERLHKAAFKEETGNADWFYKPPNYRVRLKTAASHFSPVAGTGVRSVQGATAKGVIVTGGSLRLTTALTAVIKDFPRDKALPAAQVRERLEAATAKQRIPFDWVKQRGLVGIARANADWTTSRGRYANWSYRGKR